MAVKCIRWTEYSSSVSASFHQFWESELFTDVTVSVPGGAAVSAHRAVLAARSAQLRRLLAPAAGGRPLLLLRGVSPDQLRLLLQLLYTGQVQAEHRQLQDLLDLCRDLEVEGLDTDSLTPLETCDGHCGGTGRGPGHVPSTSQSPPDPELGIWAVEAAPAVRVDAEAALAAVVAGEEAKAAAPEARVDAEAALATEEETEASGPSEETSEAAAAARPPTPADWSTLAAMEAQAAAIEPLSAPDQPVVAGTGDRVGLAAGGGASWLPSAPPLSPPPSPPDGPRRSLTPATDGADSEGQWSPEITPSGTPERDRQQQSHRWIPEPAGGAGGSAAFQQLCSLLESLDRRQLVRLRDRAHQIMHPDYTAWLPDELMVNILSRLSPRDLLVAAGACRRWRALSEDDGLWRRCLRLTGACLSGPTIQATAQSRQFCIRYLGWTELPLQPPKILKGHESVIRCMAVDGDRIVTGSSDKTVGVWSASSGRLTCRLRGESEVTCVQVEGDTVVAAARDCTIGVWDAVSGRRRHRLHGHEGIVWSVALHQGRAASGSDDKTVRLWDVVYGRQEAVLRAHEFVVRAVCFDGLWVVSGDDSGTVQVWNSQTRTVETTWSARSRYVMVLQHAHGVVVSGHGDGAVNVWDLATRQLRYELRAHSGWVTDVCVSPHDLLLSGCKDGTAALWRLGDGQLMHRLSGPQGHRQRVTAVRLLPGLAVTGSRDGRVKLWESGGGAFVRDLVTPDVSGGPVKHVWVGPDRLVCGVQNNASDRPQVLVMEMALQRAGGAAVGGKGGAGGGIGGAVGGAEGWSGAGGQIAGFP